jgi:hypothetical protein
MVCGSSMAKADVPLSGSRFSLAHGRFWVDNGMSATQGNFGLDWRFELARSLTAR